MKRKEGQGRLQMKLRRYYRQDIKYPYYITDEHIADLRQQGATEEEIEELDNAEISLILNLEEQASWYTDCLTKLFNNTSWYLDNLDYLPEFQVNWNNYSTKYMKNKCIKCGKEYVLKHTRDCKCGNTKFKVVNYGIGYLK